MIGITQSKSKTILRDLITRLGNERDLRWMFAWRLSVHVLGTVIWKLK